MSENGQRLAFDETGSATCPESGKKYVLKNSKVIEIF
jgi:hypothetical protein